MPVSVPPLPFLRRRVRRTPPTPPAVALTLAAAAYDPAGPTATLTFDRAVDIAAVDVAAVWVNDDDTNGILYRGTGAAVLVSPQAVRIALADNGIAPEPGTTLTAGADTGIVAADDGGAWAGVTELALPFP